jgi:hypothetical protein
MQFNGCFTHLNGRKKYNLLTLHSEGSAIRQWCVTELHSFIQRSDVTLLELTTIVAVVVSSGNCVLWNRAAYGAGWCHPYRTNDSCRYRGDTGRVFLKLTVVGAK